MTDFPARPDTLNAAEAVVLDALQTETAQRLHGLYISNLADATGYSTSTVRIALEGLMVKGLVKRPWHRSSRGYNYQAYTQAEVSADTARESLVSRLEDALAALVPGADFDVAGLINGGVSLRMSADAASALAEALERDEAVSAF